MKISVVIPVYNEEALIADCLQSITDNTVQPFEIIVADGGSTDRTVEIAETFSGVKVIDNPGKTAAAGRNRGILAARGEVVAFTDGDCIVDEHWIEAIQTAFETYDIDGMGGKVVPAKSRNEIEEYWGNLAWRLIMNFGDEGYEVTEKKLNDAFVTANCAYKRRLLHEIKGFNKWFANNAEDVDICWRALEHGGKLRYVPEAVIDAYGVTDVKGVMKKSFRNGVSSSKLQKVYGTKVNYDWAIYKMWWANLKGVFKKEKNAWLNLIELTFHLLGKYYGSVIAGVINI
ncbi:MAG: glycosyltransferase [Schaedlerella sp.]|nr:glycosyltransferase [Schaedlerella sp.]